MIDAIRDLARHGQSLWYDGLKRDLIRTGALVRLVEDGVRGLTTNPSIYEMAIAGTGDYDADIAALGTGGLDAKAIYEALAIQDLRAAADLMRPVWDATDGRDGFASLEVSPFLAGDTRGTIEEGLRLWSALARPNVFIKVPGTPEGMPAIEALAAAGVNVNVTLLFSRAAYRRAAEAWMAGLEARAGRSEALSRAASVASFFVSRIDTAVDRRLDGLASRASGPGERGRIERLHGKAAIANAKLAYQDFKALVASERWAGLAAHGARPQRVLFASTSVKDRRSCTSSRSSGRTRWTRCPRPRWRRSAAAPRCAPRSRRTWTPRAPTSPRSRGSGSPWTRSRTRSSRRGCGSSRSPSGSSSARSTNGEPGSASRQGGEEEAT